MIGPTAPYMCFALFGLSEATSIFLCFVSVIVFKVRRSIRWWIRIVPYTVIGLVVLMTCWVSIGLGINIGDSIFRSASSMPAINYMTQITNERIVPKKTI